MAYDHQVLTERVYDILMDHPEFRLLDIAAELGVSRRTIENVIRTKKGCSFREYRSEIREKIALKLLTEEPMLTIKEIAFTLGYTYPTDFSRFIKNKTGRSPIEIRKTQH